MALAAAPAEKTAATAAAPATAAANRGRRAPASATSSAVPSSTANQSAVVGWKSAAAPTTATALHRPRCRKSATPARPTAKASCRGWRYDSRVLTAVSGIRCRMASAARKAPVPHPVVYSARPIEAAAAYRVASPPR